jgi:hypothetical protein
LEGDFDIVQLLELLERASGLLGLVASDFGLSFDLSGIEGKSCIRGERGFSNSFEEVLCLRTTESAVDFIAMLFPDLELTIRKTASVS